MLPGHARIERRRAIYDASGRDLPQVETAPAITAVLQLQRTAGNRAVAGLLQRVRQPTDPVAAERARAEAQAALDADRRRLAAALASGRRSDDIVLRNSVEWIDTAAHGALLYAVRPTGDTAERAPAGQAAFFPKASGGVLPGHLGDNALPDYPANDLDDNANVHLDQAAAQGWNDGGRQIAIRVGAAPESELWTRVKHEVQHSADRHDARYADLLRNVEALGPEAEEVERMESEGRTLMERNPPPIQSLDDMFAGVAPPPPNPEFERGFALSSEGRRRGDAVLAARSEALAQRALEKFKTEYRAYWYMGDPQFEKLGATIGFFNQQWHEYGGLKWTPRQFAIVAQIVEGYSEVQKHFSANPRLADGRSFVQAVHAYQLPDQEGFNKLNSVRVDAFYEALRTIPANTADSAHPTIKALLDAADAVTEDEVKYLRDPTQSGAMNRLLKERLTGNAYEAVRDRLGSRLALWQRVFF